MLFLEDHTCRASQFSDSGADRMALVWISFVRNIYNLLYFKTGEVIVALPTPNV